MTTNKTEVVFAKRAGMIDDGCDHTAVILWQMNWRARAVSRSVYVPRPRPIPIVKPRELAPKSQPRRKTESTQYRYANTLPLESLIAVMSGRWLSCDAMLKIITTQHPEHTISRRALAVRISSMMKSPSVDIESRDVGITEYRLNSVDPVYLQRSKTAGGK
ncbi:hypothetical protein [Dickeya fangzhongdai]|uniref:hypothetical protein n=1 Tax=Dickeya fangzhongdai TaxID=1778540 RepID=UPI0023E3AFC1|nr:hypothetical protein [Dickeya fangzhongdai]WES88807.1 hypothetical protein PQ617_21810 [Dickeya fangzhongdai]